MSRRAFPGSLVWLVLVPCVVPADANMIFTELVRSEDVLWGGGDGAFEFLRAPAIDGQDVAFVHYRLSVPVGFEGVYKYVDGARSCVARTGVTAIPGGTGAYTAFGGGVSISAGVVAFVGHGSDGQQGIYTDPGSLVLVADLTTTVPGGGIPFTACDAPWLTDGEIVFRGTSAAGYGVYRYDHTGLSCVADYTTLIPPANEESFAVVMWPCLRSGRISFPGHSTDQVTMGVYVDDTEQFIRIVDNSTPIPGGSGEFITFGNGPSLDHDGNVVFGGRGSADQVGIYRFVASTETLECVADLNTWLPGFHDTVVGFGSRGIDNRNIAFTVKSDDSTPVGLDEAVYVDYEGAICKVVKQGDVIDGKTVTQALVGRRSISGNRIALWIAYDNGTKHAIYVVELCLGDLDGDRRVGLADLAKLLAHFGGPAERDEGDINGNGWVGLIDVEILLTHYGEVYP